MKIALFGGSFNPVHNEHINIVTSALERFDKVIIIPSYLTPDKEGRMTASAADRLNMCRLAFVLLIISQGRLSFFSRISEVFPGNNST